MTYWLIKQFLREMSKVLTKDINRNKKINDLRTRLTIHFESNYSLNRVLKIEKRVYFY